MGLMWRDGLSVVVRWRETLWAKVRRSSFVVGRVSEGMVVVCRRILPWAVFVGMSVMMRGDVFVMSYAAMRRMELILKP